MATPFTLLAIGALAIVVASFALSRRARRVLRARDAAELDAVLALVSESVSDMPHLFLLDELFRARMRLSGSPPRSAYSES